MDKRTTLNNTQKKLVKFAECLSNSGYDIVKIILFGSFAKQNFKKYSDIDVCVVIKNLDKRLDETMGELMGLSRLVDAKIEPIPYSVKEFKNPDDPLAYEIRKHGIEIKLPPHILNQKNHK